MKLLTNSFKAILFDFGGTLDSDGIAWKERFYPIYRSCGLNLDFKEFEKYFFTPIFFNSDIFNRRIFYFGRQHSGF